MEFFSKNELKGIGVIFGFILLLSLINFRVSLRRARDAQRKGDMRAISDALEKYQDDFGFFPLATNDGKIRACGVGGPETATEFNGEENDFNLREYLENLSPCEWGVDALRDLSDATYPPYLETIPSDPKANSGFSYAYFSNSNRYQLYTYLEGKDDEAEYNQGIVGRAVACGTQTCSFGLSFGQTPLDKSIEDYELELLEKERASKTRP